MEAEILIAVSAIVGIGVTTAWLASQIKLPSILLLILAGLIAGPYLGFLHPDEILGDFLNPVISLSVAIILFEGALSLNIAELKRIGTAVRGLLTAGVIVTFVLATVAAYYFLKLDWLLATLLGSLLVVTGPTVITPLMRQIRPKGKLAAVLKWEGIVIDPIGVTLAVLVFEIIIINQPLEAPVLTFIGLLKTAMFGGGLGYVSAFVLYKMYKQNWVPHFLQNAFTLMAVILIFTLSNLLQTASGLLAVTIMGIVMASQKDVPIDHIVEFKENLQLLLIPALFIILSARIEPSGVGAINWDHVRFLGALIFIVRPVAVFFSTLGSGLTWREKLFLTWMAPRGIVAAAMASVFAIELTRFGFENVGHLVPTAFFVILGTVTIYGLTAGPLAYLLRLADPNPQGVLIIGCHSWARQIATVLKENKVKTLLIDTNPKNIAKAKEVHLSALKTNILAEHADEEIDLSGLGILFAITPNEQVNSMAALRYVNYFGRQNVFQLSSEETRSYKKKELSQHIRGRILFSSGMTYEYISKKINAGGRIESKKLTKEDVQNFTNVKGPLKIPLFLITSSGSTQVFATDNAPTFKEGLVLVYLETAEQ